MKNTSDQPEKPFVFSMRHITRGKRGKSQANGNNNEIENDYEGEEEDELMEEEEEITEDDNEFLVIEDEDENCEVEDDSEDDVERDKEEIEDHQDRYEQDEAKEANEEEKPFGNEDQYLEKPRTFTIGDYVQVTKRKYCGMYATVFCVVDNSEVEIQYFEKKQQMATFMLKLSFLFYHFLFCLFSRCKILLLKFIYRSLQFMLFCHIFVTSKTPI